MSYTFNRSLHPDDYAELAPWTDKLRAFSQSLSTARIFYRNDHQHRLWEYGLCLRAIEEEFSGYPVRVLDTGSGSSYWPMFLARHGYEVEVNDSGAYGSIEATLIAQCVQFSTKFHPIRIPLHVEPCEAMGSIPDHTFDVVTCVSVIEHVDARDYEAALREHYRVTKPGGLILMTSDFFPDANRKTIFDSIQHTKYTSEIAERVPALFGGAVEWLGPHDFTYRGDFVHNYSFCSTFFRKL